jgi:beta-lactamase superfamily II metal-dependent hydrolase
MLIDGGLGDSFREHVAPHLGELASEGEQLDLVYVSHIDRDHIEGVLQLLDDTLSWRVCDFQRTSGNARFPEPDCPRPPKTARLWHNAFHEQVGANAGPIGEMLAANAAVLEASPSTSLRALAESQRQLATSVEQGIELARRASPEQLGIPVNAEFDGKLAFARERQKAIKLGTLTLTVIGPLEQDLTNLRKEWNKWLDANKKKLEEIQERARHDAEKLGTGELDRFQAAIALRAEQLGDRKRVTTPNLASLMLSAEEGKDTVLLTGDGHAADILEGLEHVGRIEHGGGLHVNVLKLQHHGSEYNLTPEFCRRLSADHYVICANGEYENPDLRVLEAIIDSRLGPEQSRTSNPGSDGPFKLWFNSSSNQTAKAEDKAHMKKVEALVRSRAKKSGGRMQFLFLEDHSFELQI